MQKFQGEFEEAGPRSVGPQLFDGWGFTPLSTERKAIPDAESAKTAQKADARANLTTQRVR